MAPGDLVTQDGQVEWRGLLLGPGTPYRVTAVEGWQDLPDARVDNPVMSGYHGAYAGQLLSHQRTITVSYAIGDPTGIGAAVAALQAATAWDEQPAEEPLVIRLDGVTHQVMARVHRRAVPVDPRYPLGHVAGAIQWAATDPRKLRLPAQSATAPLADVGDTGLVWPLVWPLDWQTQVTGGFLIVTNHGNAPAWPVLTVTGPVTGCAIGDLDTGRTLAFDPTFAQGAGTALAIDTRPGARTVRDVASGVSYRARLVTAQWWPIPPGGSSRVGITSTTYDPAASLDVAWHHTDI